MFLQGVESLIKNRKKGKIFTYKIFTLKLNFSTVKSLNIIFIKLFFYNINIIIILLLGVMVYSTSYWFFL